MAGWVVGLVDGCAGVSGRLGGAIGAVPVLRTGLWDGFSGRVLGGWEGG